MRSFTFAALVAIATAEVTEGPVTTLNTANAGSINSNGSISESWTAEGEETSITLSVKFNTVYTGGNFPNGALVQNYVQWASPTSAGKFDGLVCSAVYEKSNGTTTTLGFKNVGDSESLANIGGGFANKSWADVGTARTDFDLFSQVVDPALTAEYYGRTYQKNKDSSQKCGAEGLIFYQEGGEDTPESEQINELYWQLKNAGAFTISSGFRIWENPSDTETWAVGDAESVSWSANDWGLEDPNAVVIVPDEIDEETGDSGATALAALATALTAFLLF